MASESGPVWFAGRLDLVAESGGQGLGGKRCTVVAIPSRYCVASCDDWFAIVLVRRRVHVADGVLLSDFRNPNGGDSSMSAKRPRLARLTSWRSLYCERTTSRKPWRTVRRRLVAGSVDEVDGATRSCARDDGADRAHDGFDKLRASLGVMSVTTSPLSRETAIARAPSRIGHWDRVRRRR